MGPSPAAVGDAPRSPASARRRRTHPLAWLALGSILLGAALLRIRLLDLPLERDEGEYAYAGQLMLQGIAPYKLAWNMKFPGVYAAYALIMLLLGESTRAIHLGLLAVNAATTVILFFLAKRWFEVKAALAACATFALLSAAPGVLGMAGHATHFVILFAMAGTLSLFAALDTGSSWRIFLSGLLYGVAVLMKQQGVFLGLFGGIWLVWSLVKTRTAAVTAMRRLLSLGVGAILPLALTCLTLWKLGVFERFWFWTFRYAREYASEVSLSDGWAILRGILPDIIGPNIALWAIAGAGFVLMWWKGGEARLPLTLLLLCSILAVCPGLFFREHYFILLLPALALLVGAAADWAVGLRGAVALLPLIAAAAASLFPQRDFFFRMDPIEACRWEYDLNPFPEAVQVADYIRSHTAPGARIAILGSEPEICFYAHRLSATGYIYMYGMMESQPFASRMQREMIGELERNKPDYVVDVAVSTSWLALPDSPKLIFEWWDEYSRNYTQTGLVDLSGDEGPLYFWGADAANRVPGAQPYLRVFRRRTEAP
jgi:hypothetical protein